MKESVDDIPPALQACPLIVAAADPRCEDAEELIRLLTAELAARYDFLDDGTGNFRPEDVLVVGASFLMGRVEGQAVACGAFRPMEPGIAEIKRVFVAPEFRGRGYGARLMAELEREAIAAGYHTVRLETGTRQPESMRMYERAGFRRVPNFEPYVGSEWSVCYEKGLV